jgi:hypothetical protein
MFEYFYLVEISKCSSVFLKKYKVFSNEEQSLKK